MKSALIGILLGLSLFLMAAGFEVRFRKPIAVSESTSGWTVIADDGSIWYLRCTECQWTRLPDIPAR